MGNASHSHCVTHSPVISCIYVIWSLLFLLACILEGGRRLVSLVQSSNHFVGDVVSLVGIENVVASFAEYEAVLLVFVIACKKVLDAVAKSIIVLLCLVLELTAQTLVERLQVCALALELSLYALSLLTCVSVLLHLLLEVCCCCLELLLLLCQCVLYVLTLLLRYDLILFADLVLWHNAIHLAKSNLCLCGSHLATGSLRGFLRLLLVARGHCHNSHSCHSKRSVNVFFVHFMLFLIIVC